MRKRRRLVVVVGVLALVVGLAALRNVGRAQAVTLEVAGEPGRQVVGYVTADGVKQRVSGGLPITLWYRASRTEFAFTTAEPRGDTPFSVHVAIDGAEWGHCQGPQGISGGLERTGVPGWGVRGGGIGGLNPDEVAALRR